VADILTGIVDSNRTWRTAEPRKW